MGGVKTWPAQCDDPCRHHDGIAIWLSAWRIDRRRKVFNWPGLGRLLVDSVDMRDYPVIQAEVLLFSLEFILINLVVDVLYAAINPAIRYK